MGPDGISPKILKNIIPSIYHQLFKLFTLTLLNQQLQFIWKLKILQPYIRTNVTQRTLETIDHSYFFFGQFFFKLLYVLKHLFLM